MCKKNKPKLMYEIQRIYIFLQNDWKRHYHSLLHWIITKHLACVFFLARRNQYANVGKMFLMLFRIGVTNWHGIVIAAEGSIITLVVNMNTCKYNWKGLNGFFFTLSKKNLGISCVLIKKEPNRSQNFVKVMINW